MRLLAATAILTLAFATRSLAAQVQKRETARVRAQDGTIRVMATSEGYVEIIGSDRIQYVLIQAPAAAVELWADTAAKLMRLRNTPSSPVETHYRSPDLSDSFDGDAAVALSRIIGGRSPGTTLSVVDLPEHVAINLTPARFAVLRKGLTDAVRFATTMYERAQAALPLPEPAWAYNTEKPAQARPDNPEPKYPDVLRESNIEGTVEVQFVVDNTGVPDVSTLKVLSSSHDLFTAAVRNVVPRLRFTPAEIGGRKVPQWVRKTFDFELP
jgi:TonB family protein